MTIFDTFGLGVLIAIYFLNVQTKKKEGLDPE
jgi:hypothetical protein